MNEVHTFGVVAHFGELRHEQLNNPRTAQQQTALPAQPPVNAATHDADEQVRALALCEGGNHNSTFHFIPGRDHAHH